MSATAEVVAGHGFVFTVDGVEIGTFREVTGLSVGVEVVELREGGQNHFVHQLPGAMRWPRIVLRRGMTTDHLFAWLQRSAGDGFDANGKKLARTTTALTMLDKEGRRIRSFELVGAFAVRWSGPDCEAGTSKPTEEELEIAHHGFRITH